LEEIFENAYGRGKTGISIGGMTFHLVMVGGSIYRKVT